MGEDFLQYIDETHERYLKKNNIKNKYFIHYLKLKSIGISTYEKFYIAKSGKSRILIQHKKVWVDLTDYDIIDIICNLDTEQVLQIIDRLKECYKDNWTNFEFAIDEQKFGGKGIDYRGFDLNKEVELDADFKIKLGDFVFVLNMVLWKDIVGEQYVEKPQDLSLIKKTLIKYITLITYYKFHDMKTRKYLDSIKYPVYEKKDLLKYKMKVKKYDRNFKNVEFDKVFFLC